MGPARKWVGFARKFSACGRPNFWAKISDYGQHKNRELGFFPEARPESSHFLLPKPDP